MSAARPDQHGPFDGSAPLSLGGDVVVGEGVVLDVRLARLPSRSLALLIDVTIQLIVFFFLTTLIALTFSAVLDGASSAAVTILLIVIVFLVMPTLIETFTRGRSVGKIAMGLRVVRDDGGPVRFRHALVRALFLVFADLWMTLGVIGLFCSLLSTRAKRLGDHFAGTVAIRERLPRAASASIGFVPMPAPLAGWAARLDFTGTSDSLLSHARAFVFRAPQLDPDTRLRMGTDMATRLCQQLGVPYPGGAPPEAVIAAVLAERARRSQLVTATAPMKPAGAHVATPTATPAVTSETAPSVAPAVTPPPYGAAPSAGDTFAPPG